MHDAWASCNKSDRMSKSDQIEKIVEMAEEVAFLMDMTVPIVANQDVEETFELKGGEILDDYPLLPVRKMVLFPGLMLPITVGREKSHRLVEYVQATGSPFIVVTQIDEDVENPSLSDLFQVGVVATLDRIIAMPDGTETIVVRGIQRIHIGELLQTSPYLRASGTLLRDQLPSITDPMYRELATSVQDSFIAYIKHMHGGLPKKALQLIRKNKNPIAQINSAISTLNISTAEQQALLELDSILERAMRVHTQQGIDLKLLQMKEELIKRTHKEVDKQQRNYFLQQQIRMFQAELDGESAEEEDSEIAELRATAAGKNWSDEVEQIFNKELRKAGRLNPHSPDYSVQMQYLRTMLSLPWDDVTQDRFNLKAAERLLNKEHYGLDEVKERILEHLAVLQLKGDMKSPIICLYGPPGVGKTSLGRSIADSLGRKYVRVSLGGMHDEAEIRGHRRTYIGAMSGRIIQGIQRAGSSNPVFLLDEIDKLSDSYKGDPSSALLEVLDPEQNVRFHDNYLDVDYDLSKVLFIATANNISGISQPLRDRMEMIEVTGYLAEEKLQIAKKHLIPKAIEEHGLSDYKIKFSTKAIETIIEEYTRESGVRSLTKKIATIMRKLACEVLKEARASFDVTPELVRKYLGKRVYTREQYQGNDLPGVVVGLAWTSVGGEILFIESSLLPGKDLSLHLTGSLGDVMKESAVIALSYIKAHQSELGIDMERIQDKSVHVHVPEGAVPKDGPSAGITMVTSMVSAMTGCKVRANLAMTGEITLSGRVLPVGGIKEKILAAKRSGISDIILCKENEKDVLEINETYLKGLTFHYVSQIQQVLKVALFD